MITLSELQQIREEIRENNREYLSIFLCHMSPTFTALWKSDLQSYIRKKGKEFISAKQLGDRYKALQNIGRILLFDTFDGEEITQKNKKEFGQIRVDFIDWWIENCKS